jgi:type II secretory pathway component GspD/PulD (secretin)
MEEFKTTVTEGKVAKAYRLSKADATVASQALATLLPNAQVNVDKTSSSLIIVATEEEQQTAAATLEQIDLNAPGSPVSQVYAIASGDAIPLATALKSLIPSAAYVPDTTGKSLLVLATAEEQTQIKQTIDQWTSDPARALTTKVYQLAQANPTTALPILQKLLPAVTFSADPATRSIAAAATEEQHKAITRAVTELDAVDSSITTKIYPLGNLTAKDWQGLLTQLAPGAIAAADPNSGSLTIRGPGCNA